MSATGCASPDTPQSRPPSELVIAVPEGNVPGTEFGLGQFRLLLSAEGLAVQGVDGRAVPQLAESWTWENNDLRLRLKLRPNVFFHDGSRLNASVVSKFLDEAVASERSQSYASFKDVTSVTASGDLEVLIELSRPSAFLLDDLIMPISNEAGAGTGPYRMVQRADSEIVFDRFEKYHEGVPDIERVRVRSFDTLRAAWTGLLRGEADMVTNVPAEAVEFVRTNRVEVITYQRWFQFLLAFNSRTPQLRQPEVREALNLAIDRERLISRGLRGYARPATGPIWPEHWAYDRTIPPYAYSPSEAEQLLDRAGHRRGSVGNGVNTPPGFRMRFTCLLPANFSLLERIALEVQKQLYDVGVDVQFETVPLLEYLQRLETGAFESVLVDMNSGPTLGRLYIYWGSATAFDGYNTFGYENAEAERLFQVLRTSSSNEAAVVSATRDLQRVFLEDPPAIFLAWNQRMRAVNDDFRVVLEPGRDPMATLWRWTTQPPQVATR